MMTRALREAVHVLVTDQAMPGMRGREVARTLAGMVSDLRVLFVSGFAGDEVERLGLLEAGRPFLSKPFPWSCWWNECGSCWPAGR